MATSGSEAKPAYTSVVRQTPRDKVADLLREIERGRPELED